jgi:hypothetical protein
MNLHVSMTPTQAKLYQERKAREARLKAAAQKPIATQQPNRKIIDVSAAAKVKAEFERQRAAEDERRRKWYAVKEAKAKERWQASWRYMIRLAEQKNWDDAVISMREIMDQTADKYSCTILDLKSARRTRKYTQARFECYWRARRETALSLPQIGRLMGGRDHTTVLHGCKKYEKLRRFVLFGEHPYKGTAGNAILIPDLIITE